jgi:hypothetical protein
MTTQPPRRLTAQQRAWLAQCANLASSTPDPDERQQMVAAAVTAAHRYRQQQASWNEIAEALGIPPDLLRDWLGSGAATSKPPLDLPPPGPPAPSTGQPPAVLITLGNPKPGGNDFAAEAALIRKLLEPHGVSVVERSNVEITEFRQQLEAVRPAVLHLAAHMAFGTIHLSLDRNPVALLPDDVHLAIRAATWRPTLVVLNCCDSDRLARSLTVDTGGQATAAAAVGWRGTVNEEQTRVFARVLYRRLAGAASLGALFDDAHLTVTATWPDQARPVLHGNAAIGPLAR